MRMETLTKPWSVFWYNGQKRSEFSYVNDALQGSYTEWNLSGTIADKGEYQDGKLHGSRIWRVDGIYTAQYRLGKLHGKYVKETEDI